MKHLFNSPGWDLFLTTFYSPPPHLKANGLTFVRARVGCDVHSVTDYSPASFTSFSWGLWSQVEPLALPTSGLLNATDKLEVTETMWLRMTSKPGAAMTHCHLHKCGDENCYKYFHLPCRRGGGWLTCLTYWKNHKSRINLTFRRIIRHKLWLKGALCIFYFLPLESTVEDGYNQTRDHDFFVRSQIHPLR